MRALACASRPFFFNPPADFTELPLTHPRGSMTVAWDGAQDALDEEATLLDAAGARFRRLSADEALALCPILRREDLLGAVLEEDARDIDVDLLLQAYLRTARAAGMVLRTSVRIEEIERHRDLWCIRTADTTFTASVLINAAGAWADQIAAQAGVRPLAYRRTAFTFASPAGQDLSAMPHTRNAQGGWYIKPDAGRFLGSPVDATKIAPHDAFPEDLDVAQGIFNIMEDTSLEIERPLSTWAGLRTFATDRNPVAGFDPDAEGFFWLAGQGGCGVLTSPALGLAASLLARGFPLPDQLTAFGLAADTLGPKRLLHEP